MKNENSQKIKVVHIISGDLWAGAEVMAFNLISSLIGSSDLHITIILLNEGRLAEELRNLGLIVHIINEKLLNFVEILQKTQTIIYRNSSDIIHTHRYKENLLAFLISKRCRNIKLIATQHGLPETTGTNPSIADCFKYRVNFFLLSRYFDKTVAVSSDIRSTLINHFKFKAKYIEVVHNGIQLPPAQLLGKEGARPFVIGSSGRLFPVKDYPLMVEIAKAITKDDKADIHFELAGEGPEMATLEAMIKCNGLQSKFILRGHQDDMDSFYKRLSIYLNTSLHEGIPMAILEAMAHGLPVIAPAIGGINEILANGSEGFMIAGRNPQNFAVKCLQLNGDNELWERMSMAARKKAEQTFSAGRMSESYRQIYTESVSTKARFELGS